MLVVEGYRRLLLGSLMARTLKVNLLTQIDGQFYLLTQPLWLLRVNIDPELSVHTGLDAALLLKGAVLLTLALVGSLQLRRRPWLGVGGCCGRFCTCCRPTPSCRGWTWPTTGSSIWP